MRIPKIYKYACNSEKETIVLPELEELHRTEYVFFSDKDKVKFIKKIERICRNSLEYREFIAYLVDNVGMNFCSFFNNVNMDLAKRVKIEIHHEPFTLFDIASIVLEKWITLNKDINPLKISEEIMQLHYMGKVGLIPLSITAHQLVHDGKLFIPLQYLDQGFLKFFKEYKDYIPQNSPLGDILKMKIELSKTTKPDVNGILNKKYIYIDNKYDSAPDRIV